MFVRYKSHLKSYAQTNRKLCTKSEGLVWNCFLKGDKMGYRFLRQKPIAGYILDFYCPKLKLCIEIDGESHEGKGDYDQKRDSVIKNLGIKTIRYRDDLVLKNLESVGLDIEYIVFERVREMNPPSKIPHPKGYPVACTGQALPLGNPSGLRPPRSEYGAGAEECGFTEGLSVRRGNEGEVVKKRKKRNKGTHTGSSRHTIHILIKNGI